MSDVFFLYLYSEFTPCILLVSRNKNQIPLSYHSFTPEKSGRCKTLYLSCYKKEFFFHIFNETMGTF